MDPDSAVYRYTILLLNCLLTFGSYFCFDMPSNLQGAIEDQVLGWTDSPSTYYNLLYVIYAWVNMVMSLVAGVLVDTWGRKKSMYLFISLCLSGASIFALGASLTGLSGQLRFWIMFFGRFIFGLGGGSITISQNQITAGWFKGKELAMAFGFTLTVSRVGSVVNFDMTPWIYRQFFDRVSEDLALGLTLWLGASLIFISIISAVFFNAMDDRAQREGAGPYRNEGSAHSDRSQSYEAAVASHVQDVQDPVAPKKPATKRVNLADVKSFPASYWVICLTIACFYNIVFPFMADAKTILGDRYGLSDSAASANAGAVYTVSMVVSPFLGRAVDYIGRRQLLAMAGTALTIPTFYLMAASGNDENFDPLPFMLMLGVSYSVCAASLWPSIQLLVEQRTVGTANGVATSVQMFGIGCCNLLVGSLKDKYSWSMVLYFFTGMGAASFLLTLGMLFTDDGRLWEGQRDRDRKEKAELFKTGAQNPLLDA